MALFLQPSARVKERRKRREGFMFSSRGRSWSGVWGRRSPRQCRLPLLPASLALRPPAAVQDRRQVVSSVAVRHVPKACWLWCSRSVRGQEPVRRCGTALSKGIQGQSSFSVTPHQKGGRKMEMLACKIGLRTQSSPQVIQQSLKDNTFSLYNYAHS